MASFRATQKLVAEFIALCVPDYAAAADWGRTGRCFEIVLDASLLGGGAALFQLDAELGKPRPLAMCSRSFTTAQQAWPAWQRELWMMKEAVLEFAPICAGYRTLAWTDHRNNTSVSMIPPEECGEKVIRWWGIILQSGAIVCFLAGKVNP